MNARQPASAPEPARAAAPERILQRLEWQVIRRLDGMLQGDYRSLFYGHGIDFADLREYQPGDDVRYMDWNVTARLQAPYVRQYVEDREVTAWLLLDLSPSMDFGAGQAHSQKRGALIDLAATLARLLTRRGNHVGAFFYGRRVERQIPARGGRRHVLRLIHDLSTHPPLARAPLTDLAPLLRAAANAIRRRSLILVVSDFISAPGWEKPLSVLSRRHDVLAARLWDPREMDLPEVGPVMIEDAETGEQLYLDTGDRNLRRRFRQAAERREAALEASFKQAGVDVLRLSTDDDLVLALVRFAALRRARRR